MTQLLRENEALTDPEIETLSRFLDDHAVERDGMSFEMLDGYLTAVLSGPVTFAPSDWLPQVWAGEDAEQGAVFDDEQQANRILDLVMRHYNRIAGVLAQGGADFTPWIGEFDLEDETEGSAAFGQEWALGYLRGIGLSEESWDPLLDDPEWQEDLEAIDLLARGPDDEETGDQVATQEQRDTLIDAMVGFALDAHDYWLEQRLTPTTQRRETPKIGRNDACTCGSGKKYKQCCGAN